MKVQQKLGAAKISDRAMTVLQQTALQQTVVLTTVLRQAIFQWTDL